MAIVPKTICSYAGCRKIVSHGRCAEHRHKRERRAKTTTEMGYGWRWRKLSLAYRSEHPLCEQCTRDGKVAAATQVHHKVKHQGREELLLEWSNLESVCDRCHAKLTRRGE